jgi:DNA-binding LytR/AlgR family response regulator
VILQYAAELPFLEIAGQCYKATEAYVHLEGGSIDLLFLDINLPRLKGLDFLRTLAEPPRVVITSAYEEYALESYELRVTDYLLKPFSFERFLMAVNAARQGFSDAPAPTNISVPEATPDHLFVKVDKRHLQIRFTNIHYLESYGNYVKVWTAKDCHLTARTLASFEAELPADFARVHKSFILSKREIDYVEGALIALRSGKAVPIGKNYRTAVREWWG